ncbi:MAG: hypothetical protein E5V92_06145 [Mesorhizobium sp.]|nr:MAG: hypothetical protein E5V92_06145 [Mesorhizobium sp.]
MTSEGEDPEILALSTVEAAKRAASFLKKPDPFAADIAPSLLSADHIEKYIQKIGMISPFYTGGGRKARLKKASYEGRIGSKAYVFDQNSNELIPVLVPDMPLLIPANSIVFVECDLEFRLPRYIGLRFNLQIRHVHRGLLLGTGPLVDPGYWGKLCIPLHNLTNEPYEIPIKEGLIWVEFTKTTSDSKLGRVTLADGEKHSEHWDIEAFLRKAAKPLIEGKPSIGIRSSIPKMVSIATDEAYRASKASNEALDASNKATENALAAQMEAKQTKDLFNRIGWLGALVAAVALVTLWATFYFGLRNDINAVSGNVAQVGSIVTELRSTSGSQEERLATLRAIHEETLDRLRKSELEIASLRREIEGYRKGQNPSPMQSTAPPFQDAK